MTAADIHLKLTATNRAMCGAGIFPLSRLTRDARVATYDGCLEMAEDPGPGRRIVPPVLVPGTQEPLFDLEGRVTRRA